ncbi:MAG: type II toxin-antitoxin system HicB family antitoxin [Lentisphaerae bacterium]|nr:type II toxin-antitoxin system HicB family antitoxin [Lentisphaerota bacterium]
MSNLKYTYWEEDDMWLGYLEEFPDYMTQGESLAELEENLRDIYQDLTSGAIPSPRRVGELQVA